MSEPIPWGTMADAAAALDVNIRTIRRRIADGSIVAHKVGPRLVRVDMRSLNNPGPQLGWRKNR